MTDKDYKPGIIKSSMLEAYLSKMPPLVPSIGSDLANRIGQITQERLDDILDKVVYLRGEEYVDPIAKHNAKLCEDDAFSDNTTSARYFDEATEAPSCILGHAFAEMGAQASDFYGTANTAAIGDVIRRFGLKVEPVTARYMEELQKKNDRAKPWGLTLRETRTLMRSARFTDRQSHCGGACCNGGYLPPAANNTLAKLTMKPISPEEWDAYWTAKADDKPIVVMDIKTEPMIKGASYSYSILDEFADGPKP